MTDAAERASWLNCLLLAGYLVLILAIGAFPMFLFVQMGAPPSPLLSQPTLDAEQVAQNVVAGQRHEPEHISVTPDLEADQLFREFQAYRHWGMTRQ